MVDVFLAEKPRQKEWLPENISGLLRLSKNEIQDDIDSITQAVQGDKYRNKRKGHEEKKSSRSAMSKRGRLQEKIALEQKRGVAIKHQQLVLRTELETVRDEIVRARDAVMQKKRDLKTANAERENMDLQLKGLEENFRESLQASELRRASYDKDVQDLRERLAREANLTAETSTRLGELRDLHDALKERDAEVMHLKDSLRASNRAAQMMEDAMKRFEDIPCPTSMEDATAPVNQVVTAFIAGYSDQLVSIEQQAREAIEKLEEEGRKGKQKDTRIAEVNQRLQQEQTKTAEIKAKVKAQEKEAEAHAAQIAELNKTIEALKNENKAKQQKYSQLEEKLQVFKDVINVAEARAVEAEHSLRDMLDGLHVLRTGNKVLQGAYSRLLVDYLKLNPDASSKAAWPWNDSTEEMKLCHAQAANGIAAELAQASCSMTLAEALQLNTKQLETEKAELQTELLSVREHAVKLQQEIDQTQRKRKPNSTPPLLEEEAPEERRKEVEAEESDQVMAHEKTSDTKSTATTKAEGNGEGR